MVDSADACMLIGPIGEVWVVFACCMSFLESVLTLKKSSSYKDYYRLLYLIE